MLVELISHIIMKSQIIQFRFLLICQYFYTYYSKDLIKKIKQLKFMF